MGARAGSCILGWAGVKAGVGVSEGEGNAVVCPDESIQGNGQDVMSTAKVAELGLAG